MTEELIIPFGNKNYKLKICNHYWYDLGARWIRNKDPKTAVYQNVKICTKCHKERLGDPYEVKTRKRPNFKGAMIKRHGSNVFQKLRK